MDDDHMFDQEFNMALVEEEEAKNHANQHSPDEFGDNFGDDLDLNELVEVTETVEQQHAANNGNISFVPAEGDPEPPPPLPESTPSFHPLDVENLRTWIYPTNYPVRGYQLNIVQKAMFNNTLVALPTGLGKTFIAAVVMFNYWRWFPNSKILFMAPTRPLVSQQIEACFEICGLPQEDTVDISGSTGPAKRREFWNSKRVFFSTPQTIQNDLASRSCPAEKIVCVVVDEAHKATGNYAYTDVVRKISKGNKYFRVLALTATPGSNLDTVQSVINSLHITNIQIRTEDSMDIREFSHGKNIQSIVVRLGYTEGSTGILPKIIDEFKTRVFQPVIIQLSRLPIVVSLPTDVDRLTPYGLLSIRGIFQSTSNNLNQGMKFKIFSLFLVAEQMCRAYELLCQHGIASFIDSIEGQRQEAEEKLSIGRNLNAAEAQYFKNPAVVNMLTNLKRQMLNPDFIGHPKLDQLTAVLLKHFSNLPPGEASKVMIFSSFRSSVGEICKVLNRHSPMIRCSAFVGQSEGRNGVKGLTQFEQQEVIQKFKRDEFNVLVSTSIGEEGLDIGEVDLIICYDSQTSPIRMLQRMGRTGRKRQGKCILLLTESEERKFTQAKETYARIQRLISQGVHLNYYKPNPVIIPQNYKPAICRKVITIGKYQQKEIKKRKRAGTAAANNLDFTDEGTLKEYAETAFIRSFNNELNHFTTLKQVIHQHWPLRRTMDCLNKYVPLQAQPRATHRIGHSSRTLQFTDLVQKLEQRIMHPEEEIKFTVSKKQQTQLKLPTKASSSSTTLKMNKRVKKKTATEAAIDDAFAEFMENNNISQFVDPDTLADENNLSNGNNNFLDDFPVDDDFADTSTGRTANKIHDFFVPRKNKPAPAPSKSTSSTSSKKTSTSTRPASTSSKPISSSKVGSSSMARKEPSAIEVSAMLPTRDKGKGKMRPSQEFAMGFGDEDMTYEEYGDISWDPVLPESLYEDAAPFEDKPISTIELKLKSKSASAKQWNQEIDDEPPPIEEEEVDFDELSGDYNEKVNDVPAAIAPMDLDEFGDNDDFGDDEFGDEEFPLSDLFIAEKEALLNIPVKGFDDPLESRFPFEKEQNSQKVIDAVAVIWPQSTPKFSEEGLRLLDKRQNDIKELGGRFVAMNIFAQYKNIDNRASSPIVKPQKQQQQQEDSKPEPQQPPELIQTQSFNFEDDFEMGDSFLEQAAALEETVQKQQQQDEPQQQKEAQHQKQEEEVIPIHSQSFIDENFGEIDFENGVFADFFENKFPDGEGEEFPGANLFEEKGDPKSSSHNYSSQMAEKASLYSFDSPMRKNMYRSPSPASPIAEEEEEVYEYDFDSSVSPTPVAVINQDENNAPASCTSSPPIVSNSKDPSLSPASSLPQISSQPIVDDGDVSINKHPSLSPASSLPQISSAPTMPDNDPVTKILSASPTTSPPQISSPPTIPDDDSIITLIKESIPQQQNQTSPNPIRLPSTPVRSKIFGDDDFDQSPIAHPLRKRLSKTKKTKNRIAHNEDEQDRTETSPSKLLVMSKGLHPPSPLKHSPLKNSPLRKSPLRHFSESDESPVVLVRRKRRVIDVSPMDDDEDVILVGSKTKKRLKRKASTPLTSDSIIIEEDDDYDDDDDEIVFAPPSRNELLQRFKQSSSKHHGNKHRQHQQKDLIENPFIDNEAEKSSDEGHTTDEENEEGGSSILNSFIDDESLDPGSRASIELEDEEGSKKKKNVNIYMQSLLHDDGGMPNNKKHWMNRFDANKWLNPAEDDSIVEDEEEEESIHEFSSHLSVHSQGEDLIVNDDDDFM